MRGGSAVLAPRSSRVSVSAAQGATPRKSVPQMRRPLTRGVNPGSSYDPASLRSEGGNIPMDWVAEILWTAWQHSHGLRGNIPVDWVAEIRGIRSQ